MQQRIGVDVGGTNTDAVLMHGRAVVAWVKTATTADVTIGIVNALQELLHQAVARPDAISGVMIGTTHFTSNSQRSPKPSNHHDIPIVFS